MPLLEVKSLSFAFDTRHGSVTALDDVSFAVEPGEVLGVVGESGAGKSLTAQAVIGLIDPPGRISGGEIWFAGERIDRFPEPAMRRIRGARIGMIFQDPLTSLNPLYTVGRQLVETIQTHTDMNRSAACDHAIALLTEVGIPGAARRMDDFPHQFSGGMRQRVVIALALCAGPDMVIADEPTTALDVSVQAQILEVLKRLCRDHETAVILITHDIGVIAETADRVAVMYAGRIVETGPTPEVLSRPRHPYTIGLMGAVPRIGAESTRLVQIEGAMPPLGERPAGCAFHPRCGVAENRCSAAPPPTWADDKVEIACWVKA